MKDERDRILSEFDAYVNAAPLYERTTRVKLHSKENVGRVVRECIKLFEEHGLTILEARAVARIIPDALEVNIVDQMNEQKIKCYYSMTEPKELF